MEILAIVIGFVIGSIFQIIYRLRYQGYGYIDVDPTTEQCKVHLNPADLGNKRIKKVILRVNHDKHISREDHTL